MNKIMSRKRCHSLDHSQRVQKRSSLNPSSDYIHKRSPNRSRICSYDLRPIPSAPNIYLRNYGGNNENESIEYIPDDNIELLEDLEDPNFYDLPPDSSFDEVMCIMATPPRAVSTAAEKLDELRRDVAEVIKLDDLHRRMAANMNATAADSQDVTAELNYPYKVPPLPEDPQDIPPPPKDPNDVLAMIRRSRAIARLKALEEEKTMLERNKKGAIKKHVRNLAAPRQVTALKNSKATASKFLNQVSTFPRVKPVQATRKQIRSLKQPKPVPATKVLKDQISKPQHPTDYVPEDWAAAILRSRKLAGLKTSNAKLLPKPKAHTDPPAVVKPKFPAPTTKLATFESIMERMNAIRSKTNIAKAVLDERKRGILAQRPQDESEDLDEFEALEELYGAVSSDLRHPPQQNVMDLESRINTLQQQLLKPPVAADPMAEELKEFEALERQYGAEPSAEFPDEFEALEVLYGAVSSDLRHPTEQNVMDLQSRINTLQQQLLNSSVAADPMAEELKEFEALERQYGAEPSAEFPDEFEALEVLYGAVSSDLRHPTEQNVMDLQSRINTLQQQLLNSPVEVDPMAEEVEEFEALERQYGAEPSAELPAPKSFASNLQDRINTLTEILLQSPTRAQELIYELPSILRHKELLQNRDAMAAAAAEIGLAQKDPAVSIRRSPSPTATQKRSQLQHIDMPVVDINEIPEFAFSVEVGDDVSLGEISMPDFDEDISLDEVGLVDITPPDLYDLSISGNVLDLEPDFPIEISTEEEEDHYITPKDVTEEIPEQPGILTSVVSAIVDRFKNMFSSKAVDIQNLEEETELELDSSLPNMFQTTPPTTTGTPKPPRSQTEAEMPVIQQSVTQKSPVVIPPHPKDPKDYRAMVKRAQAIQKKKMAELSEEVSVPFTKETKKEKKGIKSSIPKTAPSSKKKLPMIKKRKGEKPAKVYPPGEYSPSYVKAVARARALAGLRNLSAVLNPERAAKIAERNATIQANLAAIEAMPPVERMREKMKTMRRDRRSLPRPSIEALATLEAIRETLPRSEALPPKRKWRPAGRFRVDRRLKSSEKLFLRDFGRVVKDFSAMSPIPEESNLRTDFIQFSPLKPHEARMRLDYLRELAARQPESETSPSYSLASPIAQAIPPMQFSPVRMQSPSSPRTDENRREQISTQFGPLGGSETGEEEIIHENLADIDPPDFLDLADMPPPRDPSIPTPNEIINRIKEKVSYALPNIQQSSRSPSASPGTINLPQDLPDEDLFDIEIPEFQRTPQKSSPDVRNVWSIEKDQRMYAWGERPSANLPQKVPTPKIKHMSPIPKTKSPEAIICIPPHPKDPKDYIAMIKRAQAIQKLKKQQEILTADQSKQPLSKPGRVPMSKWEKLPPKISKRKILVLKKRIPKISPKKIEQQKGSDMEGPFEPPPLPQEYREAVARARLLHGLKNKTAALNPAIAEKIAKRKAATAAYNALPEVEKIKIRIAELRKNPSNKRRIEPSAELLGTLAAIRDNIPPEAKRPIPKKHPVSGQLREYQTPKTVLPQRSSRTRSRAARPSPADSSQHIDSMPFPLEVSVSARENVFDSEKTDNEEFLEDPNILCLQPYISPNQIQTASQRYVSSQEQEFENLDADPSLEEFEALEAEARQFYESDTPKRSERHRQRLLLREFTPSPFSQGQYPHDIVTTPSANLLAPSMRMLAQAQYFQEQGIFDDSILGTIPRPQPTSRRNASLGTMDDDPILDFRIPAEDIDTETSLLMPKTPPRNIQERLQRLKDAQKKSAVPPVYAEQYLASPGATDFVYSPIKLVSPSKNVSEVSGERERQEENFIINIDETPERVVRPPRQFRDLEDMPFDDLEYEIEPDFTNISLEKPFSPPPRPSDIINRIKSKLKMVAQRSPLLSPAILKLPEELPDEALLELSAPSFAQTPPSTPPTQYKSPRVSLPMAWGEPQPAFPGTPENVHDRMPTPTKKSSPVPMQEVIEKTMPKSDNKVIIPPHPKDPKDYSAMIRRARAIYKLNKQRETEKADLALPQQKTQIKERVPISILQRLPLPKIRPDPKRKVIAKKLIKQKEEEEVYPTEPPPLPQDYRDAVARARLLHGLKNRTAALNPKIAARIAAKKAAQEAALAKYNALPEIEKIKVRMERLRKKPQRMRRIKPTMEQIAYLEALKQINQYQTIGQEPMPKSPIQVPLSEDRVRPRPHSITPRADLRQIADAENHALAELAEFEALEQRYNAADAPLTSTQVFPLKERIAELRPLLEAEDISQVQDASLAEFEALEALEAPHIQQDIQHVTPLNIKQLISDLRKNLATPPRINPKERLRQLMAQRKVSATPVSSPVKTPEIHYSPITLLSSPDKEQPIKLQQKTTTQITRSGDNVIEKQVVSTSEMADGRLQHFMTLLTTTTDPQGNSAEMIPAEDLEEIQEPSYLDITPSTPMELPRPRDIIERIRKQVKERYKPEVPTGHLVELRTPPRMLPLPTEVPDEDLRDLGSPIFERTPRTPERSTARSPVRELDISIPQLFQASPQPPQLPTPPPSPVSPLRTEIQSSESPLVIPPHPKDPKDYMAMIRRARKIQQFVKQNEAEERAANEAKAAEAAKSKKGRVPISRWTAPPPKKSVKRKKLVLKKRDDVMPTNKPVMSSETGPTEAPSLPEHFAKQVALARKLAGLKNRTAALNPKVAARAAAKAEAIRRAEEAEGARISANDAPPRSNIKNYAEVLSRMKELKEKGALTRGEPSLAAAAYLNALKGAMLVRQDQQQIPTESPRTRYERILARRAIVPSAYEERSFTTPLEDIPYSPICFVSPGIGEAQTDLHESIRQHQLDLQHFQSLHELDELSQIEQPSYMDVSQYQMSDDQHPITPPQTPPPAPSAIINRIRQQYQQNIDATSQERPLPTPVMLEFPEELPEDEIFEISAPSFAQTPLKPQTPAMSTNISLPRYFEESPVPVRKRTLVHKSTSPKRDRSPIAAVVAENINLESPIIPGIYPGIRVKTPKGKITVPPHPKDSKDVVAMIKRAQIIQKLLEKERSDKTAAESKVPLSKKVGTKLVPQKRRKLVARSPSTVEGPTEAVKKSTLAAKPDTTEAAKETTPPSSYATIMEKFAALKAKQKIPKGPTSRELTQRQHFINRQQRQERKRQVKELQRLRQQQGFEFQPLKTPPPARDRLEAIKSKISAQATTSSVYPYSPIKTPEAVDMPQFQPMALPQTPPYPFLQNVSIADIADISMQLDELDNYTLHPETTDAEDLEFQLAEIANEAYGFGNNIDAAELDRAENNFNVAERIEMLKKQLLESQDRTDEDILEEYNLTKRIEVLKNQLLSTPTQEEDHTEQVTKNIYVAAPSFDEDDEDFNHQGIFDELLDDFEAMEREYL